MLRYCARRKKSSTETSLGFFCAAARGAAARNAIANAARKRAFVMGVDPGYRGGKYTTRMTDAAWADAILVLHAVFVIFVVGGLAATWVGIAANRPFARNPWFRSLHLAAIGIVVAESLSGFMCPLTIWEDMLRGTTSGQGFI